MAEEKLDQSTVTVDNGGQAGPALDNTTDEIPPKEGDETPPVEDSEFEDDILPGLTGKQFESFEEPVKEIIAQTREALDVATEKATKAEERLNKLLNDPIVKHRESVID